MRENDARLFVCLLIATGAFLGLGAIVPWNIGIFGFHGYEFEHEYQFIFLASLVVAAWNMVRVAPASRSLPMIAVGGATTGFAISVVALAVSFSIFYRSDGIAASVNYSLAAIQDAPYETIIGLLLASAAALGWLYGGILFLIGRICLTKLEK